MFDRLEDLVIRYQEVMGELQEPDVANDFHLSIFKLLIIFSKQLSNCITHFLIMQHLFR